MKCSIIAAALLVCAAGTAAAQEPSLKDVFKGHFLIGTALNTDQFFERDARALPLIKKHFNSVTPENVLKWEVVHPLPGVYDFKWADKYVEFGQKNGMFIIGHTLAWHSQTPFWVWMDTPGRNVSRDTALNRLHDHIMTVVGHYKGRVNGWDVLNEVLNEDGTLRNSKWFEIIGEDYIAKAYQWAHEADPAAELYYNDYGLENPAKRAGAVALIKKLQEQGIKITGVGLQEHNRLERPSAAQVDTTIATFAALGLKVMITELDIDVLPPPLYYRGADITWRAELRDRLSPYHAALPDSVQQALANRYAELFRVFLKHQGTIERVTFWGVTDGDSWINNSPVIGRVNYPLLFDRKGKPKPAFQAVVRTVSQVSSNQQ